jgi:hypothetical protein
MIGRGDATIQEEIATAVSMTPSGAPQFAKITRPLAADGGDLFRTRGVDNNCPL